MSVLSDRFRIYKDLTIVVDHDDLVALKADNCAMCFAKKVASTRDPGSYNVVWRSLTNYAHSTSFSWTWQFALFATNVFGHGRMVAASTNQQTLDLGQTCVLEEFGILSSPTTGGPIDGVTMNSRYSWIHPGLSQTSVLNGVETMTPVYVDPMGGRPASVTLNPIETVMVWFEKDIATSTMFSSARSMCTEIDFRWTNSDSRLYKGDEWSAPS